MTQEKFIRLEQLLQIVPMSKSWIFAKMLTGEFPSNFKLGNSRAAVWKLSEINKWMEEQSEEVVNESAGS